MKVRSCAGNPIQVGGLQTRRTMRVETKAVATLLVDRNEQDVGTGVGHINFRIQGYQARRGSGQISKCSLLFPEHQSFGLPVLLLRLAT